VAPKGILRFSWNWLLIWRGSVFRLAYSFGEACGQTVRSKSASCSWSCRKSGAGYGAPPPGSVRPPDQLAKQLPQQRPFVVFAGGVAGLADRHAQSGRIQRARARDAEPPPAVGSIEPLRV